MSENSIAVIILAGNESRHIQRCISSVKDIASEIFVVDCYSSDETTSIATKLGAKVYQNKWVNYATQFNWALDHLPIKSRWIFRLDADEVVCDSLKEEIKNKFLLLHDDVRGIYVRRQMHFLGKWIRHGSMYPVYMLRIFRFGYAYCEQRWMDEHIKITSGSTLKFDGDIIDINLNNLGWWINKHNSYSIREAIDILNLKFNIVEEDGISSYLFGTQEQRKRWLKIKYAKFPLFVRPAMYFIFRYFFKLGFLDGKEGLVWHFLQGFWYRFLVDAKIYEIYLKGGKDSVSIKRIIKQEYGIEL